MLVAGLSFHLAGSDEVAAALQALAVLTDGAKNKDNKLSAFRAGATAATLTAMDKHWSERAVVLPACKVLWYISAPSPEKAAIRTEIGECGGVAALNATLAAFDADESIVNAVLGALKNIMAENPANKAAVIAANGIERVTELLPRFPDNACSRQKR